MSSVPRYQPHYSYEDYCQWSGDWELWNGNAVAMTPSPFGPHERLVSKLVQLLRNQIDHHAVGDQPSCKCEVYAGLDWIVARDTVVRPDVMVVCGEQPTKHLQVSPSLIAEVLVESTESKDRNEKRLLYERQGVPFYLLADTQRRTLDGWRLENGEFEKLETVFGTPISVNNAYEFSFDAASLFSA